MVDSSAPYYSDIEDPSKYWTFTELVVLPDSARLLSYSHHGSPLSRTRHPLSKASTRSESSTDIGSQINKRNPRTRALRRGECPYLNRRGVGYQLLDEWIGPNFPKSPDLLFEWIGPKKPKLAVCHSNAPNPKSQKSEPELRT